jgi:hypothetical protein
MMVAGAKNHARTIAGFFHFWNLTMPIASVLSPEEFASLREVAKGQHQDAIPPEHEARLCALNLTHRIFGRPSITDAGRSRLASGI